MLAMARACWPAERGAWPRKRGHRDQRLERAYALVSIVTSDPSYAMRAISPDRPGSIADFADHGVPTVAIPKGLTVRASSPAPYL